METWTQSIDLPAIIESHGSPVYILHRGQLRKNLDQFVRLVGDPCKVAYPVKTNPSLAILRELSRLGCSADCSSPHEVDLALSSGFPIQKIIYNSPAPDRNLMVQLLASGSTVVADSVSILDDLQQNAPSQGWCGRLLVRVNPEQPVEYLHRADWQDLVSHASSGSKFGIPSENLTEILAKCKLSVAGLHIHVGTQMDNTSAFVNALRLLHDLKDLIERATSHRLGIVNIGGGLGIPFTNDQVFPAIEDYVLALNEHFRSDIDYIVEPGHSLVGNAVALLAQIRELKEIRGKRWAILDVGSDQLIKVTLLSWSHQIIDRKHRILPNEGPDAIGGPLCFAGDILLSSTSLEGQRAGDPLLIQHVGAYCFAVSNHFNGYQGPAHVTVTETGDIQDAYRQEDAFADHCILGFNCFSEILLDSPTSKIDLRHVERLSSQYLKDEAACDSYTFTDAKLIALRSLEFTVDAQSPLGAISIPFALRIASDAVIVAVLYFLGKESKDISVWGTRSYMASEMIIRTASPLTLRVHISPEARLTGARHVSQMAHWEINGGKFRGAFRFTL